MAGTGAMFWSGETLSERLRELIDPFDVKRIDCAAYTLSIGEEVYVSPSDVTAEKDRVTIRKLAREEAFTIPPGQFAFLLTEEIVRVPDDALALISIRAKSKFRGLVNVSGFHVDPGYRGQLTFAVFNAGPATIHLKRGQAIFLIWYASLDGHSNFKKNDDIQRGINPELINNIAGELQSFASLTNMIKDVEKKLNDRMHKIDIEQRFVQIVGGILITILIAVTINWVKDKTVSSPPATAPISSSTSAAQPPTTAVRKVSPANKSGQNAATPAGQRGP